MNQALKVIQFDSEESQELVKPKLSSKLIKNSVAKSLNYAAITTAVLGVLSLILEIKLFFQFSYELYLARLFPTIVSFLTLILLNIKFGKKHLIGLLHIYLASIIFSVGFFVYKVPQFYIYNLMGTLFLVMILSQFLTWKPINQIAVASYFIVSFLTAAILSKVFQISNIDSWVYAFGILGLLSITVLTNYLKQGTNVSRNFVHHKLDDDDEENYDYQEFLDRSVLPLFQLTFEGEIKYANSSFYEILGNLSETELKNFNFFNHFVNNSKVKSHILKKLESKGRVENYRVTILGKNGTEEVYLLDCRVDNNQEENLVIEGSIKNITQIQNKENEFSKDSANLKSSQKIIPSITSDQIKKPNLISKLGHELKTPMNSVLGFLTLIENGLFETEEELKEFSRSAKISAESLLNLMNDILELSKIEDGIVDVVETEFDIRSEIEKVITSINSHLKEKNLSLAFDISDSVPEKVISDPIKFGQILMNLISNAIDSTESGEVKILVSTKHKPNNQIEIMTAIEDTSKGVESSKLQEMLNIDLLNGTTKPKITTTLLRIIISKELLKLLDGKLSAKSEIGKGTRFTFSIFNTEVVEEKIIINDDGTETKIKNDHSKSRLLLVEDNPISRKVEKKLLEDAGYSVDCVDNGLDAIEKIKTGIYNIVLMDIELKDMNGLETTKKIRELSEDYNKIPIVAVTAHSSMKDREKCLLAGMNDYISKPINITFLKMTIDQWLNAYAAM